MQLDPKAVLLGVCGLGLHPVKLLQAGKCVLNMHQYAWVHAPACCAQLSSSALTKAQHGCMQGDQKVASPSKVPSKLMKLHRGLESTC